ncbi:hypothetical protein KSP35_03385 [Aquihabitans sp. G128]|uniref:hypothetical protein n=1 Tax=Aquihabitans sp. G128 TaxID=2849779 RepID=UPI001C221AFF|nr:hypothetical protein [Aquihabitans sp. G128]QXC61886.1 hypothetical protein KSP35_03385 [Aquihabitans sp. G128]
MPTPRSTPTPARRALTAAAMLLLLSGSVAACGASGGSDADDATTTTTARATTTTDVDDPDPQVTTTTDPDDDPTTTTEPGGGGGDDGAYSRDDYVTAMIGSFDEDDSEIYTKDQIDCLADRFVDVIGVDDLNDAGVTPKQLAEGDGEDLPASLGVDEELAGDLYDQFAECDLDLKETFTKALTSFGGAKPTTAQLACLDRYLTDDNLRRSFVADYTGEDLADDPIDKASECLGLGGDSADSSANSTGPTTTGP